MRKTQFFTEQQYFYLSDYGYGLIGTQIVLTFTQIEHLIFFCLKNIVGMYPVRSAHPMFTGHKYVPGMHTAQILEYPCFID